MSDLVSLPDVYLRARAMIDEPGAPTRDLAAVVSRDPGLTIRILKLANSAYFAGPGRVETVDRAFSVLGLRQVNGLVLSTSVASAFGDIPYAVMNMTAYWWNSVYCAVAARLMARRCNVLDPERLFVAGLLRDIGHLVMYQSMPESAAEALYQAQQSGTPLFLVERELFGFDYAQVGRALLESWNMPPALCEGVGCHTEPSRARRYRLEAAIVHLAGVFTDGDSTAGLVGPPAPVDPSAAQLVGSDADQFAAMREEAARYAIEAVGLILPAGAGRESPA